MTVLQGKKPFHRYFPGSAMAAEALDYEFMESADIVVRDSTGATLSEGTDYVISGDSRTASATITAQQSVAAGVEWYVFSVTAVQQQMDLQEARKFALPDLEREQDRLSIVVREQQFNFDRSLKVPEQETGAQIVGLLGAETESLLQWDGEKFVVTPFSNTATGKAQAAAEAAANEAQAALSQLLQQVGSTSTTSYYAGLAATQPGQSFSYFDKGQLRTYVNGISTGPGDPQAVFPSAPVAVAPPRIRPGISWDGTLESGWASVPTDPARTTAKPWCRLIVPDRQAYTDTILVGVDAGAVNGGSIYENEGLSHVVFDYEGRRVSVSAPSFQDIVDASGETRTYYGWWAELEHTGDGGARLFVEAVPRDAAMQSRVYDAGVWLPSASVHSHTLEVAPSQAEVAGTRYQTAQAALDYWRALDPRPARPHLIYVEAGTYPPPAPTFSAATREDGYLTISATAPITFAATADQLTNIRPLFGRVCWRGSNITFDHTTIGSIIAEGDDGDYPMWFDGVNFTLSGGPSQLRYGDLINLTNTCDNSAWFTECTFDGVANAAMRNAYLVRGCTGTNIGVDWASSAQCIINTVVQEMDQTALRERKDALFVDGPANSTLSLDGTIESSTRTMTAKENGVSVGTLAIIESTPTAWGTRVSEVRDWINGLAGWSATLLDGAGQAGDTIHARNLTNGDVANPGGWTDVDVSSGFTFTTWFDLHNDWWQGNALLENIVIRGNRAWQFRTLQTLLASRGLNDSLICNNAFARKDFDDAARTQFAGPHSHVAIVHNTLAEQTWYFRENFTSGPAGIYNADARCLFKCNAVRSVAHDAQDADLQSSDNHFSTAQTGAVPSGDNQSVGGTDTTNYANVQSGDFRPRGDLLQNLKVPAAKYTNDGHTRGLLAPAGAF